MDMMRIMMDSMIGRNFHFMITCLTKAMLYGISRTQSFVLIGKREVLKILCIKNKKHMLKVSTFKH